MATESDSLWICVFREDLQNKKFPETQNVFTSTVKSNIFITNEMVKFKLMLIFLLIQAFLLRFKPWSGQRVLRANNNSDLLWWWLNCMNQIWLDTNWALWEDPRSVCVGKFYLGSVFVCNKKKKATEGPGTRWSELQQNFQKMMNEYEKRQDDLHHLASGSQLLSC